MADAGRDLEQTEKYLNPYWVLNTENINAEKILINIYDNNVDDKNLSILRYSEGLLYYVII